MSASELARQQERVGRGRAYTPCIRHGTSDEELRAALRAIDSSKETTRQTCCSVKAVISFEKRIAENSGATGDSRASISDDVRGLMDKIQLLAFPQPELVGPLPAIPSDAPTVAQLTKVGQDCMARKAYKDAAKCFSTALSLPLRQRGVDVIAVSEASKAEVVQMVRL